MRAVVALAFLAILKAGVVLAGPLEDCLAKADNSPETAACYGQEAERSNAAVRVAYQQALKRTKENDSMSAEEKKDYRGFLVKEQVDWGRRRERQCRRAA